MRGRIIAVVMGACLSGGAAQAQGVPGSVSFTARLVDNGVPVTGTRTFDLKLFDAETGGSELWTETHAGVSVASGLAYLSMGETSSLDAFTLDGSPRWLEISVNGTTLTPRLPVESVPYAIRAGVAASADTVGGLAPADLITGVGAGTGLLGGGSSGDVMVAADTAFLQRRVSACGSGQTIQSIAADGTPTCLPVGTGDVTSISTVAGSGLAGGVTAGDATLALISCPTGNVLESSAAGWVCSPDDLSGVSCAAGDTLIFGAGGWACAAAGDITGVTTAAGSGLSGGAASGSPSLALAPCAAGQVLRHNGSQWVCADDQTTTVLSYGRTSATPGTSCANIKSVAPWSEDGVYIIDPDGTGPIGLLRVRCDMTRDGGGWTYVLKNRYQSGIAGRVDGFGSVDDLDYHQSDFYKLPDVAINAIIGDGTFDILADQVGYNSTYSNGNHEFIIVRNYTGTFSFTALVPESTTETVFESYRSSDGLLVWRGRLQCGYAGGVGINCYPVLSTPSPIGAANPQGGAGCLYPLAPSTSVGWHHFFMSETNSDTYLYICNGAQHSSGHDMSHQWWVR